MLIAVLAWGSLVWCLGSQDRKLELSGDWQRGGPTLPIEFSRVSQNGRLTLVIDPEHGAPVETSYATSALGEMEDAAMNLAKREGMNHNPHNIGFVDLVAGTERAERMPEMRETVAGWAKEHGYEGVVWTDLPSNFEKQTGEPFSVEAAVAYLRGLKGKAAARAREYFAKAPRETETAVRRKVRDKLWGELAEE